MPPRVSESFAPSPPFLDIAARFTRAPTDLLRSRRLQDRIDTKYVLSTKATERLLASLTDHYLLAANPEHCMALYRTVWFDTPDLICYHRARRMALPHQKIRIRQYSDLRKAFFEIKSEVKGRTLKHRLLQDFAEETLTDTAKRMVQRHTDIPIDGLSPSAVIVFRRMTLLNERSAERVTIDLNIDFEGARSDSSLNKIAIIEVKQKALMKETPVMRALSAQNIPAIRASKYCTTMALKDAALPRGHVQAAIRTIQNIQSMEWATVDAQV